MRAKEVTATSRKKSFPKPGRAEPKPEAQVTYEIANLRPERTGLPFVVFISQRGGTGHDVRVKVAHAPKVRGAEMVTVALRSSVRVVMNKS